MIDITNPRELKDQIKSLQSGENKLRKRRSFVTYDIYNNNQHEYVMKCLKQDYPKEVVPTMRTVTSINFSRRIVDAEARIYRKPPKRFFRDESDQGIELMENHYQCSQVNFNNKMANRYYRLDEQVGMMMVPNPVTGAIGIRHLFNWQYDVIPHPVWYQHALAYIIPMRAGKNELGDTSTYYQPNSDQVNEAIADPNDNALSNMRFMIWSQKHNFICNGLGEPIGIKRDEEMENPIDMIPIIDISAPKQNSFFLSNDNSLARFTIDYLLSLTDLSEIVKMQGFAQAILSAIEQPKETFIGPHRVLFLKKDKNMDQATKPEFQFANPSPDLQGSLDANLALLRMFLSNRGHKTNIVTASENVEGFSSGVHKLLAMIEEHEASIDDFDLFKGVEDQQFEIMRRMSNYLQDANIEGFTLKEELRGPQISDDAYVEIEFAGPEMVETEKERQTRLNERLENGTISKKRFIMEMDKATEEEAMAELKEIDEEDGLANA